MFSATGHIWYKFFSRPLKGLKARKEGTPYRQMTLDDFIDIKSTSTMKWLRLLIRKNLPLSYCEDLEFRNSLNAEYKQISLKTLTLRMDLIVKKIETEVKQKLAETDHIILILDGWTERANHYLAVFAVTPKSEPLLLAFSPFINEEALTADEHIKFLDFVVDLFAIDVYKIRAIVADNTSTNKLFARKIDVPFIGCASHRLSLAVNKNFLVNHKQLLEKVHRLMVKLGTIKRSGMYFSNSSHAKE